MYIVSTDIYIHNYTDYAVRTLDDVEALLLNEEFLSAYGYLFHTGVTGFSYGERESRDDPVKLIVHGVDFEEATLYLYKIKVIGE